MINHLKIVGITLERPGKEGDANRPPVPTSNAEFTISNKYFNNFWWSLNLPLINYQAELDLWWTKKCALIERNNNIRGVNFAITSIKLYVPVVTLSIKKISNF